MGDGTHGAGPLRVILHINNSRIASYLICKIVITIAYSYIVIAYRFCISMSLAREMVVTLTHDATGRLLPLVTMSARELGDG